MIKHVIEHKEVKPEPTLKWSLEYTSKDKVGLWCGTGNGKQLVGYISAAGSLILTKLHPVEGLHVMSGYVFTVNDTA